MGEGAAGVFVVGFRMLIAITRRLAGVLPEGQCFRGCEEVLRAVENVWNPRIGGDLRGLPGGPMWKSLFSERLNVPRGTFRSHHQTAPLSAVAAAMVPHPPPSTRGLPHWIAITLGWSF